MTGFLLPFYQIPPGLVVNNWATELLPPILPRSVSRLFACLLVHHLVPRGWLSFVPHPGSMFVLGRFSAAKFKPCEITKPGEICLAEHMLLLEGKKPDGEIRVCTLASASPTRRAS